MAMKLHLSNSLRGGLLLACVALIPACETTNTLPDMRVYGQDGVIEQLIKENAPELANRMEDASNQNGDAPAGNRSATRSTIPLISAAERETGSTSVAGAPTLGVETVDTVVPPLPVPDFIDLVFGKMLSTRYVTGPGVADNDAIVQLRSSGSMPAGVFLDLVSKALEDYGVRVIAQDGAYQIVMDSSLRSRLPRFIRSRARAGTPAGLRPIVQFVELNAINAPDMADIIRQAFGNRDDNLSINTDDRSNYIILSGLADDVDAALSIILEMDELRYAGTQVLRYAPDYWSAVSLAAELRRILTAEGWQVSNTETQRKPILILPIEPTNDVLVFTRSREAMARVNRWLRDLDRPTRNGGDSDLFVYDVNYLDADVLADTVNRVLLSSGSNNSRSRQAQRRQQLLAAANGAPVDASGGGEADLLGGGAGGRLVVDPYGNRLIFSGTANEYSTLRNLLEELDQPAAEVLIEAAIAQITLSDSVQSGVEWVVQNIGANDVVSSISSGGLGLAGGGLDVSVFPGNATVEFNAFAENSEVTLLATPRLVARSGSSARVQVGTEVPTLSAQRLPAGGGVGDNQDVISSVVYRSTGIILEIEPIVFSNNLIDLTISQEVSSTAAGSGEVQSPTFNNTSVNTQLSLSDGATAVIGGLIQNNFEETERGIPLLKDIPLLGQAFSVNDISTDRTELVILITAYVLRGQNDKTHLARKMSADINETIGENHMHTLRPRYLLNEDKHIDRSPRDVELIRDGG